MWCRGRPCHSCSSRSRFPQVATASKNLPSSGVPAPPTSHDPPPSAARQRLDSGTTASAQLQLLILAQGEMVRADLCCWKDAGGRSDCATQDRRRRNATSAIWQETLRWPMCGAPSQILVYLSDPLCPCLVRIVACGRRLTPSGCHPFRHGRRQPSKLPKVLKMSP
jgi:hypothetical protein